jgi:8-oxo-dGTP diphosphatase
VPKNYVLGFAFNADRTKIVMIRKTRPAWQAGRLNGLGGKIEPGETQLQAMCREFAEETGVTTQESDWHYYAELKALDSSVYCYRLFDDKILAARTIEDQEIILCDVDLNGLTKESLKSCSWLIAMALDDDPLFQGMTATYNQHFNSGYEQKVNHG